MYCRNCGQQLPEEAKFCPFCGTDVPDLETLLAAARAQQARQTAQAAQESSTDSMPQGPQAGPEPAGTEAELFLYEDLPADDTADAADGADVPPVVSDGDETMVLPEEFVQQYGQAEVYNADMPRGKRQQDQTINSARAYIPEEAAEEEVSENAPAGGVQRIPKGAWIAILAVGAVLLIFLSAFLTVRLLDNSAEDEVSITQEAQSAYNEGDYETAISVLENWLDGTDSATSTVYRLLARSYFAQGEVETAAEVYADGYAATGQQTLADSAAELWLQLAEQAASSTDAAYYYNLVLTLDPDNETALSALNGTEDAAETETDGSTDVETEAAAGTEEDAEAGTEDTAAGSSLSDSEQAQAFYDAGDYNGAEVLLYSMRRSGNMSADDYALYGLVLVAQDREDAAVTTYYEGYSETGDTSLRDAGTALALELAAESIEKGDYEVAQIWYETILEYDSTNAEAAAGLETVDELLNPAEPVYETQYTVVTGSYTWEEARLEAAARGGQLAIIPDLDTWNTITGELNSSLVTAVWIGGRTGTPGDWDAAVWVDGSSISYTRWYTGQPEGGSSYLSLVLQDGSWYYSAAYEDLSAAGEVTGFVMETTAEVSAQ